MNKNDYIIRRETAADYAETENLVREAFWNVYRPGCFEHYLLHVMRNSAGFIPELDFVMEKDGEIIGQNVFCKAEITADDGKIIPILTMGPIGILPEYKRKGYGKALLDFSLEKATELGYGAVCFEGNIDFYGKSGFVLAGTKHIRYYAEPEEEIVPYFLLKELKPGYLDGISGVYHTPEIYFVKEEDVNKFDEQYPPKQKLKLPGQLA